MEWINSVFLTHSSLQAVIILSIICAVGLALGKVKILGVSLGATFVFFMGIVAGHLGITINSDTLYYVENFGLVLFIFTLGMQVGPGFFSSFRKGGVTLNILGLSVVLLGTLMAIGASLITGMSVADMIGVLCGAVTNTPALGAAQQALKQVGLPSSSLALGCAVAYPLGVVGVILALAVMRVAFFGKKIPESPADDNDETFVAEFKVVNPAIFGKSLLSVSKASGRDFVVSRLWRGDSACSPASDTILEQGDRLLVVTSEKDAENLNMLFGERVQDVDWNNKDIDWNSIDRELVSSRIVITKTEWNGKKLGALKLRHKYGVNTTRIYRSGVQLLARPGLRLQMGDRLTVVGEARAVEQVEKLLGNAVQNLNEPNLIGVFIGMSIGLILGAIPIAIPGMSVPVKLGLAGGPVIVGILIGTFGPRFHMVTYVTRSANLMLRSLGLSLYLACLGLDAGGQFFDVVIRPEGAMWVLLGFLFTIVPVFIVGFIGLRFMKIDFATLSGALCGSMANPMALNYSNESLQSDVPSAGYATVYPFSMFARLIIVQVVILLFMG
ncbi:MAG: putative transporter [Muribaculaceae bacterium]